MKLSYFYLLPIYWCSPCVISFSEKRNSENADAGENKIKEEKYLEFDAIKKLHIHLDDDKNGDVDFSESEEFLKHELHLRDQKRHSKFHSGDGSISVNDLWKAWKDSEVVKWSSDEVADWLTNIVHLPQYTEVFKKNHIDGHYLPRLASPDDGILVNELKISNVIDRKKIALRAMDIVLFGPPTRHNYLKDVVLGLAVLVAMAGFWFSNVQKRNAQEQMKSMMKDIEFLQEAENKLTSLQNRLKEAEASHQVIQQEKFQLENNLKDEIETAKREAQRLREAREDQSEEVHTRLKLAEEELIQVNEALRKAEKEVENLSSQMSSSLQKWLQITYLKEVKNFQYRRNDALRKMMAAKESCQRLKRKRSSLLGALRLAHDQNIDEVDERIIAARTSLAEVTNDLEELQYRWQQIETCARLDLGVCTSFLCSDIPDSPRSQTRTASDKIGSLDRLSSHSRESLPMHRVHTCPSLDYNPPSSHGMSKSKTERNISAPAGFSDNPPKKVTSFEERQNDMISEYDFSDTYSVNNWSDFGDGFEVEGESFMSEQAVTASVESKRQNSSYKTKAKNSSNDGVYLDNKPDKNAFSNAGHKKKWWNRPKKRHSGQDDLEPAANLLQSSEHRYSSSVESKGS